MKLIIFLLYVTAMIYCVWSSDDKTNETELNNTNTPTGEVINTQAPQCIICFETFPLMMQNTCGHKICALCFGKLIAMKEENVSTCPLCRKPYGKIHTNYKPIVYQLPINIQSLDDLQKELEFICKSGDYETIKQWMDGNLNLKKTKSLLTDLRNSHLEIKTTKHWIEKGLSKEKIKHLLDLQEALPFVCEIGVLQVVKNWMDLGLDPNMANIHGFYPIHFCSTRDVIKYLEIEKHADMNLKTITAVLFHHNIYFREGGSGFQISYHHGYFDVTQYWIDRGEDVNKVVNELTPLCFSCFHGDLKAVKFFIENGADVNKSVEMGGEIGFTPLIISSIRNYLDVVKYLITKGANINQATLGSSTVLGGAPALNMCSYQGNAEAVKFLLSEGAHGDLQDSLKCTPIFVSAQEGHLDVVKCLMKNDKARSVVNQPNIHGTTPLIISAQKGYLEIVECLVENGAKIDQSDFSGNTPLFIARKKNEFEVTAYLEEVIANGIGKRASGKPVCAVCQGLAKLRCSACKNVWYCGKEHQKEDWKIHKAKCEFFNKVVKSIIL